LFCSIFIFIVYLYVIFISDDVICLQTLSFGSGFCLCVRLCFLPGTQVLLLSCAADDAKIHLFAESTDSDIDRSLNVCAKKFVKVDSLVGHEDWVRAMDFTLDGNYKQSDNFLLMSGCK
jgi:elongator complex protein 2